MKMIFIHFEKVMLVDKKISKIAYIAVILALVFAIALSYKSKNVRYNYKNKTQKVIGIIPSYDLDMKQSKSVRKHFNYVMLRDRYLDSFVKVCKNTTFIILPLLEKDRERVFQLVDGIVISGGDDINGKYFKQKTSDKVSSVEPDRRTDFQIEAIKHAMKNNKPLLGICNGMQAINIVRGGDLIQDIPSMIESNVKHKGDGALKTTHKIDIAKNTWFHDVVKANRITVNSNHHQAVGKIGKNIIVSAKADDGIVEAIECSDCRKPVIGVQWHPEFLMTKYDKEIIKAFCDAVENE